MDAEKFFEGMRLMASIFPVNVDGDAGELRAAAYLAALGDLTNDEWSVGVTRAVREEKFFPPPARIRELAGPTPLAVKTEAAIAFGRLFDKPLHRSLTTYSPHSGDVLDRDKVLTVLGPVAFQAFVTAGGVAAFETADDGGRPFLEKRFVEAYREAVEEFRRTGELPAAEARKALPGRVRKLVAGVVRSFPAAPGKGGA